MGLRKNAKKLCTLLCEVEEMLNSRLITFVSNELWEGQLLTPACFFTERRRTACPVAERKNFESSPEVWKCEGVVFRFGNEGKHPSVDSAKRGGENSWESFHVPMKQTGYNCHVWR